MRKYILPANPPRATLFPDPDFAHVSTPSIIASSHLLHAPLLRELSFSSSP